MKFKAQDRQMIFKLSTTVGMKPRNLIQITFHGRKYTGNRRCVL